MNDEEYFIYDISNPNGQLRFYYDFISKNHNLLDGDICEVGVFRGDSLLATALLLKSLGSSKKVIGFDSFSGFPGFHENDDFSKFEMLFQNGEISKDHFEMANERRNKPQHNFNNVDISFVENKIKEYDLDNVILVKGSFEETMNDSMDFKFMACLIDCDLYQGYKVSLPYCWNRLVKNGYIYLDEYFSLKYPGARIATNEFISKDKMTLHSKDANNFERWGIFKNDEL